MSKLVPDNLKTGITHASFYDPVVNRSYHELARHYGTGVVPARVQRPRDKAAAEKGVQIVETRVLAALRNRVFFRLDEANAAIRELVAAVNARPLTINRTLTRCRLFEEQEKPLLMPLPAESFVIGRWSRHKLAPDYHVSIEGVAYSVPYRLIGRHVDVFSTVSLVSIFHKGQRVAAHARHDAEPGRATVTLDEHGRPNHRAAVLLTPEAVRPRLPASAVRSGCWPTGSSPMPIIPTRRHARSPACCAWVSCTAPWLCRPRQRRR